MSELITIDKLNFSYGSKKILKQLSLRIKEGESIAIIGPNGAGKSTLLKILMRIETDYSGSIEFQGQSLKNYQQKELAKDLSYVPQGIAEQLQWTVLGFIAMGRYPQLSAFDGLKETDLSLVEDILNQCDLNHLRNRYISSLSGGERQRVLIAAALAQEANCLLLDEVASYLDPKHQSDIYKLLGSLEKKSKTIISVTHDINAAAMYNQRIIALKNGQLKFDGSAKELMKNETLNEIYDKEFLFFEHPQTGQKLIVPELING